MKSVRILDSSYYTTLNKSFRKNNILKYSDVSKTEGQYYITM